MNTSKFYQNQIDMIAEMESLNSRCVEIINDEETRIMVLKDRLASIKQMHDDNVRMVEWLRTMKFDVE